MISTGKMKYKVIEKWIANFTLNFTKSQWSWKIFDPKVVVVFVTRFHSTLIPKLFDEAAMYKKDDKLKHGKYNNIIFIEAVLGLSKLKLDHA